MRKFEFWKQGLENVLASAMRSALTVLGMSIGVAAILAVITLGDAGRMQVKQEISRLGIDRVQVTAADPAVPLTRWDASFLQKKLHTEVDEVVCLESRLSTQDGNVISLVVGCSPDYWERISPQLIAGKPLLPGQWYKGDSVAFVGEDIAGPLKLSVGEWFFANGMMLCCAGIMGEGQQASQLDLKQAVIVPQPLLHQWMGDSIQEMTILVPEDAAPEEIAAKAERLLLSERSVRVNAVSMQLQAEAADSVVMIFVDVLRWVALICMLVGGIGVMNILLVSVRERRREIGVMQSLGATGIQICGLFMCEALIYAFSGGILGLLMGGALIAVAGKCIGLTPLIKAHDCTVVFMAAVLLGLISGVVPAAAASRMKPVDALRDE